MRQPRQPHEELTAQENEHLLGELTTDAWRRMSVAMTRAAFWDLNLEDEEAEVTEDPMGFLLHEARKSSGSIRGAHRRDLTTAVAGKREQRLQLATTPAPEPESAL